MLTTINCDYCGEPFQRIATEVARSLRLGRLSFCSPECIKLGRLPQMAHEPNATCALCALPFYKKPSSLGLSKSGLFFCCRAHKDAAQRIGGIVEIMPAHYGMSRVAYRKTAFDHYEHRCDVCGWSDEPAILEVHHRDHDETNNVVENLQILCPTHHALHHFQTNSGKWRPRNSSG